MDTETKAVRDGVDGSRVAAANAEYRRWGTGGDSRRPPGERAWACRQNDNGSWRITTYHRNEREADEARHEQALAAATGAALAAPSAAGGAEMPGDRVLVPRATLEEAISGLASFTGDATSETQRRLREALAASPSQGSDMGEAGRDPFIPGYLNDLCLAGKHPAQAGRPPADLSVPSTERGDVSIAAANGDTSPTAPQGADLAGLSAAATRLCNCVDNLDFSTIMRLSGADVRNALRDALAETRDALAHPGSVAPTSGEPPLERVRHVKSGGIYEVLCAEAQIQTDVPLGDYAKVSVYRGEEPPHLTWVRPIAEMEDGRFEPVPHPASQNEGVRP